MNNLAASASTDTTGDEKDRATIKSAISNAAPATITPNTPRLARRR
jgi:hypothetical protein